MASILIVEDCEELRSLLCEAFEQELGARCLGFKSFADVKNHEQEALLCQVAVLDINLGPGQPDGVEIHNWLRAQSFAGGIFFLTGHASDSPLVQRAAATRVPVLEKPISPGVLLMAVRKSIAEYGNRVTKL